MKTTHILIGFAAFIATVTAGNVTIPYTFSANTTAKASEVNENFSTVKNSINDNAGDISINKDQINANQRAIDNKISSVTASGGIVTTTSDMDVSLKLADGYVPVTEAAFHPSRKDCYLAYDSGVMNFDTSSGAGCGARASVPLPSNAILTGVACRFYHEDSTENAVFYLYQSQVYGGNHEDRMIGRLIASTTSSEIQIQTMDVLNSIGPDDTGNAFTIEYYPPNTDSAGDSEAFIGCFVYYRYE